MPEGIEIQAREYTKWGSLQDVCDSLGWPKRFWLLTKFVKLRCFCYTISVLCKYTLQLILKSNIIHKKLGKITLEMSSKLFYAETVEVKQKKILI